MINFLGCSAQAIAIANGATTLALLEHLVERKILDSGDVRAILSSGIECLEPRSNVRTVAEAVHLMRDHMLPLFCAPEVELFPQGTHDDLIRPRRMGEDAGLSWTSLSGSTR